MRIESHVKALLAAKAALSKHAEDLEVLDLRALSSVTDFFVIGTAASHRQMRAIVEQIEEELAKRGQRIGHVEGLSPPTTRQSAPINDGFSWVLMDSGDLVIHLFTPPARTFYQLERLWADAPRISLDPSA